MEMENPPRTCTTTYYYFFNPVDRKLAPFFAGSSIFGPLIQNVSLSFYASHLPHAHRHLQPTQSFSFLAKGLSNTLTYHSNLFPLAKNVPLLAGNYPNPTIPSRCPCSHLHAPCVRHNARGGGRGAGRRQGPIAQTGHLLRTVCL